MHNLDSADGEDSIFRRYTVFNCQPHDFAIPISDVQEVLTYPKLTRVPNVKTYIRGVFNLRGRIYTVIDLEQLFGLGSDTIRKDRMVVLIGKPGEILGILVDQVKDMTTINDADISVSQSEIPESFRRFVSGYCEKAGSRIYLIDAGRVIEQDPSRN